MVHLYLDQELNPHLVNALCMFNTTHHYTMSPVKFHVVLPSFKLFSFHNTSFAFNPFATGNTPVCDCISESAESITVHVVQRNNFPLILEKCFLGTTYIVMLCIRFNSRTLVKVSYLKSRNRRLIIR